MAHWTSTEWLLALSLCACTATKPPLEPPAPTDAGAGERRDADARDRELPKGAYVDLAPEDSDAMARWSAASDFTLTVSSSHYQLQLDASGHEHFRGDAGRGSYDDTVSQDAAASLYGNLIDSGFLRLADHYLDESDGCVVLTDMSTVTTSLSAGGMQKQVEFYAGCLISGPAIEAYRRAVYAIDELTGLTQLITPCKNDAKAGLGSLQGSYVLRGDDDQPVGVLTAALDDDHHWRVSDCAGAEVANVVRVGGYQCGQMLMPAPSDDSFAWPGVSGPQLGVQVSSADDGDPTRGDSVVLQVSAFVGQVTQHATVGDTCL